MFCVINIYKPRGLTSHDVVGILRKILGIKQIGHTGTLDPFAEGVLPVCVGKATKLIDYFDDDKEYLATISFGTATDTYDIEGKVVNTSDKKISEQELTSALKNFQGEIKQIPPIYSAIKLNGKKLYEYAREGQSVEIEPRTVFIHKLELKNFDKKTQQAELLIKCSKGTYIRSIAHDLGETLGCFGHLSKLVRTQAGKFLVENSTPLPVKINYEQNCEIQKKYTINETAKTTIEHALQSPLIGLSLQQINISETEYNKVIHGISLNKNCEKISSGEIVILIYNNNITAIGIYDNMCIKVKKVFG